MSREKMTTCLWFDKNGEDAVNFYTSIFKDSSVGRKAYYTEAGKDIHGMPPDSVLSIEFKLNDMNFILINGGPQFKFNEAISIMIYCNTQEEIDYYWEKLNEGGDPKAQQCGWLKDKFGLSWQVTPNQLEDMMTDKDRVKVSRVTEAMMAMKKLDIAKLEKAFSGE